MRLSARRKLDVVAFTHGAAIGIYLGTWFWHGRNPIFLAFTASAWAYLYLGPDDE